MRPFDLEKAKAGHPLVTRDGRPAKFITHLPECSTNSKIVALIAGNDSVTTFAETGQLCKGGLEYKGDLFLATTKKTYWFAYGPPNKLNERYTSILCETEAALQNWFDKAGEFARAWTVTSIEIEE